MSNAGTTAAAAATARRVDSTTLNQSTMQPLTATVVPYNAKGFRLRTPQEVWCVAETEAAARTTTGMLVTSEG